MSAIGEVIKALEAWPGETVFIARSMVDEELRELCGMSGSQLMPQGKFLGKQIYVIPDVLTTKSTTLNSTEFVRIVNKGPK